jgi:hypothetical protein
VVDWYFLGCAFEHAIACSVRLLHLGPVLDSCCCGFSASRELVVVCLAAGLVALYLRKQFPVDLGIEGESQFSGSAHLRALPSSSSRTVSPFQSYLYILACNFDSYLYTLYMHARIGNILLCDECELSAISVSFELFCWAVVAGY